MKGGERDVYFEGQKLSQKEALAEMTAHLVKVPEDYVVIIDWSLPTLKRIKKTIDSLKPGQLDYEKLQGKKILFIQADFSDAAQMSQANAYIKQQLPDASVSRLDLTNIPIDPSAKTMEHMRLYGKPYSPEVTEQFNEKSNIWAGSMEALGEGLFNRETIIFHDRELNAHYPNKYSFKGFVEALRNGTTYESFEGIKLASGDDFKALDLPLPNLDTVYSHTHAL